MTVTDEATPSTLAREAYYAARDAARDHHLMILGALDALLPDLPEGFAKSRLTELLAEQDRLDAAKTAALDAWDAQL